MSDTYCDVHILVDVQFAPGVDPVDKWKYVVMRKKDKFPICVCSTKVAADYIEMLLNDRPHD